MSRDESYKQKKSYREKIRDVKLSHLIKSVSYDELYNLYIVQGLSLVKIGKMLKCRNREVRKKLVGFDIPIKKALGYKFFEKYPNKSDVNYQRTKELRENTKMTYERDNFQCQECNKINCRLIAHHIEPPKERYIFDHSLSNLITVCESCHSKIHVYLRQLDASISSKVDNSKVL